MTADRPWLGTSRSPQERATALVAAMSTEQKIAQLHGNMETINIYEVDLADEDALEEAADQFDVKRHVTGEASLGIPRMRG